MNWRYRVKIKHLFTEEEDWDSVQASMLAIASTLLDHPCFSEFDVSAFTRIPEGDDIFGPVDYANRLLDRMYDYADANSIWIE